MSLHVVGDAARFDTGRNTSALRRPAPNALELALAACAETRRRSPELVRWLQAGAPSIRSHDEHVQWFGCAYTPPAKRKRS